MGANLKILLLPSIPSRERGDISKACRGTRHRAPAAAMEDNAFLPTCWDELADKRLNFDSHLIAFVDGIEKLPGS